MQIKNEKKSLMRLAQGQQHKTGKELVVAEHHVPVGRDKKPSTVGEQHKAVFSPHSRIRTCTVLLRRQLPYPIGRCGERPKGMGLSLAASWQPRTS